ncbi:sensor histidine kinase [Auritidibacter ignavus]|uniref:sensor histidine kinase n=1 Tax=Auritidibacter ignavus TaxID=678932 RepID=UPI00244A7F5E|nr:histidine kinase [Auritidibacter ignavus]WGH82927.1 histidine kinase [Auritidibacter ignavus]
MNDPTATEHRRELPTHWLRTDALISAGLIALGLVFTALSHRSGLLEGLGFSTWGTYLSVPLLALPMVLYRRFPCTVASCLAVMAVVFTHTIGVEVYSYQILLFLSFYGVGAWSNHRRRALWVRVGIIGLMTAWLIVTSIDAIAQTQASGGDLYQTLTSLGSQWLINVLFYSFAWVFGNSSWRGAINHIQLRTANHQLSETHRELRETQEQLATAAVHAERMHIARELHDVVAHHVTVMGIHASAARRGWERASSTAASRSASLTASLTSGIDQLRAIETASQEAIAELRNLVYTLRDQPDHTAPLPDLSQLADLVDTANSTSQTVRLEIIEPDPGTAPHPEVPSSVQLTLYRIAQEGINNARKHAGATATVVVRLRYLASAIELEISDNGHGDRASRSSAPSPAPATTGHRGTGTGLRGMTERVVAMSGTLTAGPKSAGGWLVRASIPLTDDSRACPATALEPSPASTSDPDPRTLSV